jgi:hypothetical protein
VSGAVGLVDLIDRDAVDAGEPSRPPSEPLGGLRRLSARHGFHDDLIARGARRVLDAAECGLSGDPDRELLATLWTLLEQRRTPAHVLIERFHNVRDLACLLDELAALP